MKKFGKVLKVLGGFAALGASAFAQTAGTIDLAPAQTSTTAIIAVGVAITTALTVYKLGKRAANRA